MLCEACLGHFIPYHTIVDLCNYELHVYELKCYRPLEQGAY
jgi:hypothetical protein